MSYLKDKYKTANNEKEYLEQLYECVLISKDQVRNIKKKKLPKIESLLNQSRINLNDFVKLSLSYEDFTDTQLEKVLFEMIDSIDFQLNSGLQHMNDSLINKQKHLSRFTVTLFGRTKAGKSTIREALTNGDGSSIGKGLQRTTRDIKEYEWNYLRIIDTPGIGAYEGDEDVAIAESVIDESDVILFLLTTDGIQESEFEKLAELKSLNKPIVILLNVKQDLTNNIRRKRFLSNWEHIVSRDGQLGHLDRIKNYTEKYLGIHRVKVIPIHAQAAFLSALDQNPFNKDLLYESSRIDQVKKELQEIVINEGTQHRIKTFLDAHIYYLNSLSNVYWDSYRKIRPRVFYLRSKFNKFNEWFNKFNKDGLTFIDNRVKEIFAPSYADIGNFVDNHAGKKDADVFWKKKMENQNIQSGLDEICKSLGKELQSYLSEFSRQLKFELQSINFENQSFGINEVSKGVIGRVARWGGAALGVGEGALIIGSLMNFWNPAGWVMGAIGLAAVAVNIFGWIIGDDTKRYEKEKDKIKNKMTNELRKKEHEIQKELKKWFKAEIITPVRNKLSKQVIVSMNTMEKLLGELEKESKIIDKEIMSENRELIAELYKQSFGLNIRKSLSSIARVQGDMTKILYKDMDSLFVTKRRIHLEKVLGERVITVKFCSDPIELFKRAMFPVPIKSEQIQYEFVSNRFIITSPKEGISRIIGKKGRNIKTTSKLLDCIIEVQEEAN